MKGQGVLSRVKALLVERTVDEDTFRPAKVCLTDILEGLSGLKRRPVLRVLDRLCRDGDLKLIDETLLHPDPGECGPRRRCPSWRVLHDLRQRRDCQVKSRVTWRDKLWSTLRCLHRAVPLSELCRLTDCDESMVREYLLILASRGYIAARGKIVREKAWVLLNDLGPRRPETPRAAL